MCKAMAPECTVPIRTGRRATTRLARNIPRAVAISKEGWGRVHQRQAARVRRGVVDRGVVDIAGAVSDPLAMSIAPSASGEPPPPTASTAAATATAAATSAAPVATSAASVAASAASVAAAGVVAAVAAAAVSDKLYVGPGCTDVFLVEDIERRQADICDLLLIQRHFMVRRDAQRWRLDDRRSGRVGCAACQRQ